MNISALYNDYHEKSGEQISQINTFVANGLLYIIKHYFAQWSSYFVLTLCCRNNHTCNFYNDMFQKMFAQWQEWPLQIVIVNKNEQKRVLGARQYNMIFTDSYKAFLQTEIHTYMADSNTNEYYFIFLQTRDHLQAEEMQKIFEYCWQHYLINCVVEVQKSDGRILIYSYYPFTPKYCGQVEAILINEYNGISLVHEELFPKKLKNLYGCPLKAALWDVPPYLYLRTDMNNVTHVAGGFEGKLLLELAKRLNFSLNISIPPDESKRGVLLKNGSLTGALQLLNERQADLSLGSFRQNRRRSSVATPTTVYFQTELILATRSDAFNLNSLETILYPFANSFWILLLFFIIMVFLTFTLLRHLFRKTLHKSFDHITLDVLLILLGMPAYYKPISIKSQILNISWIIFSFVLRTVYQALLFHLIRSHVTRNIPESLEELVQQNYTLILDATTMDGVAKVSLFEMTDFVILNTSLDVMPLMYLEDLSIDEASRAAAVIPIVFLHYYTEHAKKIGVFQILPYNIMNFRICMYLTKHSFLVDQFNDILLHIKSYGLLNAWYRQEVNMDFFKRNHLKPDHILDFKHLKMAFILLLMGYSIAIAVFLVELLCKRMRFRITIRKLLIMWNYFSINH